MSKIYFDTEMGAAGDMLAAALADLLDNPDEAIAEFNEAIKGSGIEDVVAEVAKRFSQGVSGEEFNVSVDEESLDYPEHHHPHHRDYHDHHEHRDHHFDEHHHHWNYPEHHHYHGPHYHDHDHPHFEDHHHDDHWDSPHFGDHPHVHPHGPHHGHYEHPRFEDRRPHPEERCCHRRSKRTCAPIEMHEHRECGSHCPPIELHFHLHLGDTFVEEKKRCKHRKHHHHHHKHHCHHKHRDGSKREAKKRDMDPKPEKTKKTVNNKKTISMSHPKDHLDV